MNKMMNQIIETKRRAMKGGDEDDGNKGEAPSHIRVRQNVQRDHHVDNILGDIKKGVITRSHVAFFFVNNTHLFFLLSLSR
jgi:hypothetical protein